jgi:hypothetical protein
VPGDEATPAPVAAAVPPFVATPTVTTERSSTLSRLFPDLVGPAMADPVAPAEPAAVAPPGETVADGEASPPGSEPTTPEPGTDRSKDE